MFHLAVAERAERTAVVCVGAAGEPPEAAAGPGEEAAGQGAHHQGSEGSGQRSITLTQPTPPPRTVIMSGEEVKRRVSPRSGYPLLASWAPIVLY